MPSATQLIYTLFLALSYLALFGLAEFLYHILKVRAEITRKLVHVGSGLISMSFPILLDNHWLVLLLGASFTLIIAVSLKFELLKSINKVKRVTHGSILYPLSIYLCYLFFDGYASHFSLRTEAYFLYYLPLGILAISDPIAALAGKTFPFGKYKSGIEYKTFFGSGMFFLSAFLISIVLLPSFGSNQMLHALLIALAAACAEAFSKKGWDNIFIPLSAIIVLYSLQL
ncbi:MAG: phosphatidate cytidylyltransferase [Bacteroidetes bacterium B1(2017)]|nr:MAG: phosphatidate cytidylyltransferase [Bacteroidetes bacterium B1(2017)]